MVLGGAFKARVFMFLVLGTGKREGFGLRLVVRFRRVYCDVSTTTPPGQSSYDLILPRTLGIEIRQGASGGCHSYLRGDPVWVTRFSRVGFQTSSFCTRFIELATNGIFLH